MTQDGMVRIIVETPFDVLEGWTDECQDFDGRFSLTTDDGERFMVSGWLAHIEFPQPRV